MSALLENDDVARRVAVASTEEARLDAVRRRFGDRVVTGVAARSAFALRARSVVPGLLGRALPVRGAMAQLPARLAVLPVVDRRSIGTAHALGIEVHVWTVDDPGEMHRLLDEGVDGLMTDRPDLLREVLLARGDWVARPGSGAPPP
jgi:glycerophosphoryl diester phosphodiesterase